MAPKSHTGPAQDGQGSGLWLNPVAAARKLGDGFSAGWLKRMARERAIPHTRGQRNAIGFTEADLAAILEQRRVEAEQTKDAPSARSRARRRAA